MFEKNLTHQQQCVFLYLINEIVTADKKITTAEQNKINLYKDALPDVYSEECAYDQLAGIFISKQSRASIMLELISVGMADGLLGESEDELLQKIAFSLSISTEEFAEMQLWVTRMIEMVQQSQAFMED